MNPTYTQPPTDDSPESRAARAFVSLTERTPRHAKPAARDAALRTLARRLGDLELAVLSAHPEASLEHAWDLACETATRLGLGDLAAAEAELPRG